MNESQSDKKALEFLDKHNGFPGLVRGIYITLIFLGVFSILIFSHKFYDFITNSYSDGENSSSLSGGSYSDDCTVAGIELHGTLLTYIPEQADSASFFDSDSIASQDVDWAIRNANEDENIKAILLEVDSSGGSPIAGEEISIAVKNSVKPVVGLIRQMGLSSAYLSVSSADKIFASKYSDVGSIGVTMSYLSNADKNKAEGYTYEQLSSGKFKDAGSADKPLTKEEKDMFMRDINIMYENFVKDVSMNRNIPIEKIRSFADGSSVLGEKAKELGLIDEIGGLPEVENYIEELIQEKPEICWE